MEITIRLFTECGSYHEMIELIKRIKEQNPEIRYFEVK